MKNGKKRSGSRTKRRRTSVKKVVNRVLNQKTETKRAFAGEDGLALYHNQQISALPGGSTQPLTVTNLFNIWRGIVPGTNSSNRVGTEIIPRGMKLRMYLENLDDRPNLHYRIICGFAPKQRSDGAATAPNNLELLGGGGPANNLLKIPNADRGYKVLYDRIFRNEMGISTVPLGGTGGKRAHIFKEIWLRPKKGAKITYNGAATGVVANIVNNPFFCAVIPYDSQNTLATDDVARLSYTVILYFKDA